MIIINMIAIVIIITITIMILINLIILSTGEPIIIHYHQMSLY